MNSMRRKLKLILLIDFYAISLSEKKIPFCTSTVEIYVSCFGPMKALGYQNIEKSLEEIPLI